LENHINIFKFSGHISMVAWQVMDNLDGQGVDHNFFRRSFSNVLPRPSGFALKVLWQTFGLAVQTLSASPQDRCHPLLVRPHDRQAPRIAY
jgi:hypothetical protein